MADLYDVHPAFDYWRTGRYGTHGLVNSSWAEQLEQDPRLDSLVMTVELVFGSDAVVYISSKPCTTTSGSTGKSYQWLPLLEEQPSIELTYSLGEATSSARSFTIRMPASLVDPTVLIAKNRMLGGIGEVSLTYDGGDYDDRIVVIRGEMDSGVSFGPFEGGILETTVTDPRDSCDVSLPPYLITAEGFPEADDSAIGQRFPIVFPKFNYVPGVFIDKGTPNGDEWQNPIVLLASGTLSVDHVFVDGNEHGPASTTYPWEVVHDSDNTGQLYTGIKFLSTTVFFDLSEAVYATVSTPGFSTGTASEWQDAGALETDPIGQVSRLISSYTILQRPGANAQLFAKAQARLINTSTRVCVNAGGSSNTSTISYIEGAFLSTLPMVSMVWESGAYGPVVTDRMGGQALTAYLVAGQAPLLSRATVVQESAKTEINNEFQLRYAYDAMRDIYEGVGYRNSNNSTLCKASQRMVGFRPAGVLDSLTIHDSATAEYVLDWLVAHIAVPSYYVEYEAEAVLFFELQRGDNIDLTDSEFGWENKTATVETLRLEPGKCTVGFRVWLLFAGVAGGAYSADPVVWGTNTDQNQEQGD